MRAARCFPMLQHALDTAAVGLILGDSMVQHLPADVARRTDAIICGFLHARRKGEEKIVDCGTARLFMRRTF